MKQRIFFYATLVLTALSGFSSCRNTSQRGESESTPSSSKSLVENDFKSDEEFLDYLQKSTFNYMWKGAEENSGLAPERIHLDDEYPENDRNIVTTGGSGFGIAGIVTAMDRGFITRKEGVERLAKIVDFLGHGQMSVAELNQILLIPGT